MAERVANIGERGAHRRRMGGIVWLVVGVAASIALLATDSQQWLRLLLVAPFGMAAMGLLQAREKT